MNRESKPQFFRTMGRKKRVERHMTVRFLKAKELCKTKPLAAACFGSGEELDEYYEKDVPDNRIAVLEDNGVILSMAQLRRFLAVYEEKTVSVWYILYVCTLPGERHRGYMDRVMHFVLRSLREEGESFCFLVPVDPAIYRHLGFTHMWKFNESERELLYAEDGLENCFACLLSGEAFTPPVKLMAYNI